MTWEAEPEESEDATAHCHVQRMEDGPELAQSGGEKRKPEAVHREWTLSPRLMH